MSRVKYNRVGTSGAEYTELPEQITRVYGVRTPTDPLLNLRAADPPFSDLGAIALTATFAAVGTSTVTCSLWLFDSEATAADDNSTIIKPYSVASDDPGRWLKAVPA